jgi:hypothetical protein
MPDHERVFQTKFSDTPTGKLNAEKMNDLLANLMGSCLLGFIENCNHTHSDDSLEDQGFFLYPTSGYIVFKVPGVYKAGQEFNYQYQSRLDSTKTVFNYGFYYRGNPYKTVNVDVRFNRAHLTKQKYDILNELKFLDSLPKFDGFFNQNERENLSIDFPLSRDKELILLKILKLITYTGTKIPINEIKQRLLNNFPLDYNSEMLAPTFLRTTINYNTQFKNLLKYVYKKFNNIWIK